MINFDQSLRVMIGLEAIDFRAGLNRLAAIAQAVFQEDPRGQCVFVFRNKRQTDIKLIVYHVNGYFLGHKRLSKGKLSWWPRTEAECRSIDASQLVKLLQGMDPRGEFHPDWYKLKDHGEQGRAHIDPKRSGPGWSQDPYQEEQPRW
ncbi:MAG: IS66 family insertion sequence element accessory protein TnpB [Oligoflexus sp.]